MIKRDGLEQFRRLSDGRQGKHVPALEKLRGSEEVRFLKGSQGPSYLRTDLDVCTDGSGPAHGDHWHQNDTAGHYSDGQAWNADITPYLVLPPQGYTQLGTSRANVADLAVLRYGDRWCPAILGEVGPRTKTGEASYRAILELTGKPSVNPNKDAIPSGVETLIFPGSGLAHRWTPANTTPEALKPLVEQLMASLPGSSEISGA